MDPPDPLLVLACGSRSWFDSDRIGKALDDYLEGRDAILLHGGAGGADRLAGEEAKKRGIPVEVMPADWKQHGRRAGFIRNVAMLDRNPDLVLAFWNGTSRGTWHTVTEARARKIVTVVVEPA